jgi:putative hydrolases of HD superfamily
VLSGKAAYDTHMTKPDLQRLLDLQLFLLQFRAIERVSYLPGRQPQRENDMEHSYTLAVAAWFLAHYFPDLDRDKVIRYALAHDIVEVHAGDTYIFADDDSIATKKERERAALERIKQDWPDFTELTQSMEAYEERSTPEAKFVYALDKIMPIMLNYLSQGHGWRKHNVTIDMLHQNKKDKVALSPEIQEYYNELLVLLRKHAHYFSGEKKE